MMNYENAQNSAEMSQAEYANRMSAQTAIGGKAFGLTASQATKAAPCLRERTQVANERLSLIAGNLSSLVDAVVPSSMNGALVGKCDTIAKDSTLMGDVDDLLSTISLIEQRLNRLSSAITG